MASLTKKQQEQLAGVLRALLATGAGYAVAKGKLDPTTAETLVGAVTVLGTIAWSVKSKR